MLKIAKSQIQRTPLRVPPAPQGHEIWILHTLCWSTHKISWGTQNTSTANDGSRGHIMICQSRQGVFHGQQKGTSPFEDSVMANKSTHARQNLGRESDAVHTSERSQNPEDCSSSKHVQVVECVHVPGNLSKKRSSVIC